MQLDQSYYNKTYIDSTISSITTNVTNISNTLTDLITKVPKISRFSFMPSNTVTISTLVNNLYYYHQINVYLYTKYITLDTSSVVQNCKIRGFNIVTYLRDGWLQNTSHDNLQYNNFEVTMSSPDPGPAYGASNFVTGLNIRSTLTNNPEITQEYNGGNGFIIAFPSFDSLLFLTKSPSFMNCLITNLL